MSLPVKRRGTWAGENGRLEEGRGGEEGRSRGAADYLKKKRKVSQCSAEIHVSSVPTVPVPELTPPLQHLSLLDVLLLPPQCSSPAPAQLRAIRPRVLSK